MKPPCIVKGGAPGGPQRNRVELGELRILAEGGVKDPSAGALVPLGRLGQRVSERRAKPRVGQTFAPLPLTKPGAPKRRRGPGSGP